MVPKKYRDCLIKAQPVLLAASRAWGVRFTISRPDGERSLAYPETYPSEKEAVARCLELATRIIDARGTGDV